MRVVVDFAAEQIEFDLPEERLVGVWHGPDDVPEGRVKGLTSEALEHPDDFPALRQAVVPGDHVVLAVDPRTPGLLSILSAVCDVLIQAGVEGTSIQVVGSGPPPSGWSNGLPAGVEWIVHDPEDRSGLAYLASTPEGRRIYLNRVMVDADFVLPIGRIGFDPIFGFHGPWSVIFPALSDRETLRDFRSRASTAPPDLTRERASLTESEGVSWLLGSLLQMGVIAGKSGVSRIVAGTESLVKLQGSREVNATWTFRAGRRADLVVVGIGRPGESSGIDDLAEGLWCASRLVRRGGKIAVLSNVRGTPGPAVSRLVGLENPRDALTLLKGSEADADHDAARKIASALVWADVYLWSGLDPDLVEDLGMIALGKPSEVRRLVDTSDSCLFVSQAESTRAERIESDD